jgi:hypothetical protein
MLDGDWSSDVCSSDLDKYKVWRVLGCALLNPTYDRVWIDLGMLAGMGGLEERKYSMPQTQGIEFSEPIMGKP